MAQPASQPNKPTNAPEGLSPVPTISPAWIGNRYEIQHPLGRNQKNHNSIHSQHQGPVRTFLAWDHQRNINVVLKALPFGQLQGWKPLELFEREARSLSQLDHPAIPRYLDYIEHREADNPATTFYLVQTYVDGLSLGELVQRGDRFSEENVKAIARQGLEILDYLHRLNPPLIHRDIKPDNLICSPTPRPTEGITVEPQIYLVDFGAAQAVNSSGSTVIGTYGYMAPEQFRGQANTASDLYSFGATLLHLLTHEEPIALPTQRLRIDFRRVVHLSEDFALWLDGLLEPIASDRFHSAHQALEALDKPSLIPGYGKKAQQEEAKQAGTNRSDTSVVNPGIGGAIAQQTSNDIEPSSTHNWIKPSNSKICLQRHSGSYPLNQPSLTLEIPPIGLQRELWALGGFALIWNGGLLYWLIMAWAMDAPWFYPLVSAPLWGIGLLLMGRLGQTFFGQVRLVVDKDQYCLEQQLGPIRREKRGPLSDWQSIDLRQQYSRDSEAVTAIAMVIGTETIEFGIMLSEAEKQWLVSELQDFLSQNPS